MQTEREPDEGDVGAGPAGPLAPSLSIECEAVVTRAGAPAEAEEEDQ
jgi:hypothetical protein